jgi:hypothetical protein
MQSGKGITEVPTPKRIRTYIEDQQDHLEYGPEHEALVSLANETFGLYTWSHSVTHQSIGKCVVVAQFCILKLYLQHVQQCDFMVQHHP